MDEHLAACTGFTQADLSVSGLTVAECEALLSGERDRLIAFGVAFLRDEAATAGGEEFSPGEEGEPSETVAVHGLGVGFGVTYAIYHNFLARRTPAEFTAYLKNRRIPHQARFARELRRVFAAVQ